MKKKVEFAKRKQVEMPVPMGVAMQRDATIDAAGAAMLMCGRPAPCRPKIYASDTAHFFPLTRSERLRLLNRYPPTTVP